MLSSIRITIDSQSGEQYGHDKDLRLLESIDSKELEPRMTLIAPFGTLLCDLARTKRLFEFEYIYENFRPASKRKFGVSCIPSNGVTSW